MDGVPQLVILVLEAVDLRVEQLGDALLFTEPGVVVLLLLLLQGDLQLQLAAVLGQLQLLPQVGYHLLIGRRPLVITADDHSASSGHAPSDNQLL